ncbi:hypothetical protein Dimus_018406, partial [Dionaea muscipula]
QRGRRQPSTYMVTWPREKLVPRLCVELGHEGAGRMGVARLVACLLVAAVRLVGLLVAQACWLQRSRGRAWPLITPAW